MYKRYSLAQHYFTELYEAPIVRCVKCMDGYVAALARVAEAKSWSGTKPNLIFVVVHVHPQQK